MFPQLWRGADFIRAGQENTQPGGALADESRHKGKSDPETGRNSQRSVAAGGR